jgi:hypothetical protein
MPRAAPGVTPSSAPERTQPLLPFQAMSTIGLARTAHHALLLRTVPPPPAPLARPPRGSKLAAVSFMEDSAKDL